MPRKKPALKGEIELLTRKRQTEATIRLMKTRLENPDVTLRVCMIDWHWHDFTLTMSRDSSVFQVQHEIAKWLHDNSVLPSEIMLYCPKKAMAVSPPQSNSTDSNDTVSKGNSNLSNSDVCDDPYMPLWQFLGELDPVLELDHIQNPATLEADAVAKSDTYPRDGTPALIPSYVWKQIPSDKIIEYASQSIIDKPSATSQPKIGTKPVPSERLYSQSANLNFGVSRKETSTVPIQVWYDIRTYAIAEKVSCNVESARSLSPTQVGPGHRSRFQKVTATEYHGADTVSTSLSSPNKTSRQQSGYLVSGATLLTASKIRMAHESVRSGFDPFCGILKMESKSLWSSTPSSYMRGILERRIAGESEIVLAANINNQESVTRRAVVRVSMSLEGKIGEHGKIDY